MCVNPTTGDTSPPYQQCPEGTKEIVDANLCQTRPGGSGSRSRHTPVTPAAEVDGKIVEFNQDDGTGFIPRGQVQGALKLSNTEFERVASMDRGFVFVAEIYTLERTQCLEESGEIVPTDSTGNYEIWLNHEVVTNAKGQVTGF